MEPIRNTLKLNVFYNQFRTVKSIDSNLSFLLLFFISLFNILCLGLWSFVDQFNDLTDHWEFVAFIISMYCSSILVLPFIYFYDNTLRKRRNKKLLKNIKKVSYEQFKESLKENEIHQIIVYDQSKSLKSITDFCFVIDNRIYQLDSKIAIFIQQDISQYINQIPILRY